MHAHLARNVSKNDVSVFQFDSEGGIGHVFHHFTLHLDDIIFRHIRLATDQPTLEVRLLEQTLVLVAHDVSLNLGHEIHRDHHNNE